MIIENFGALFSKITQQSQDVSSYFLFEPAIELKDKVIEIIQASKSIKEDIASLRQSISQLSSVVQSQARLSLVKGISIVKDDGNFSVDNYSSLPVSSECSHNEIIIRNNI